MILQNSREKIISLKEEIDALLLYIDLEKLRFEESFKFNCIIDENVDTEDVQIPPMILQPYVENAIWHGLMHKEEPGHLILEISRRNSSTVCIIDDDGVGWAAAQRLKSNSATRYKSMGLGITKDRIAIHNRMNELGIKVDIEDKTDEQDQAEGTRIIISIPDRI
jgi:LytS/YehU family sensor histidine kinase